MKKDILPKSGIYLITNIVNWKRYVGKDSNLPNRWGHHKRQLNLGTHKNSHLQRSWKKYGESAFVYSILRYCKKEDLIEYEQFYMDLYDCVNNDTRGYNKKNADGSEMSEETCAKISASLTGKKLSEETKAKISIAHSGKVLSKEHKN